MTLQSVRWADRYYPAAERRLDFTCWHFVRVDEKSSTACGRIIPREADVLALEYGAANRTNCRQCLNRREVRGALVKGGLLKSEVQDRQFGDKDEPF